MTEFDKYRKRGAYHWAEIEGALSEINPYTLGRYELALSCLRSAGVGSAQTVVDIGAGDGALTGLLRRRLGCTVIGIEPDPLAVELARGQFEARGLVGTFVAGSASALPMADSSADAAVSADVIEHVQDAPALLAEARRILKPGGVLVVTTPIRVTERPQDRLHVQEWFEDEFKSLCASVFGPPVASHRTHPAALVELYRGLPGRLGALYRRWFNHRARAGKNPFLRGLDRWSLMTTQALVLRKSAGT
ncbi:MAG: class I SAM-dependent methyltransferase [Alphaproteobacteria bacterium]|nr:class I SAM-dependent methyltransferase [Alphaproteobacteria bacterium]